MSLDDGKTCLVCGRAGGMFARAMPYFCRDCYAQLSPEQLRELQTIRKKGLPRLAGALVCIVVAMVFFIANFSISNMPLHFLSTFIGLGFLLVGNCITMGNANSLKPDYREFALKIAQEKGNYPVTQSGNLIPSGRLCPSCHAPISSNATFCGSCGRKLENGNF
jgi:hypothetical protein